MKKCIILFFGLMAFSVAAQTNEDLNVYGYWKYYGDMSNNLYKQLYSVAAKQIADRKKEMSGLKTPEDWQNYQAGMRQKLQRFFGTFPEKTPLNPVVTGIIKKDGFTVEKLYFESRPGYYVTAALFLPTNVKGKKPYCSGHAGKSLPRNLVPFCSHPVGMHRSVEMAISRPHPASRRDAIGVDGVASLTEWSPRRLKPTVNKVLSLRDIGKPCKGDTLLTVCFSLRTFNNNNINN